MVFDLYDFIIERVNDLKGKLQIIIVNHADLKSEKFRKLVTEDLWNPRRLVQIDTLIIVYLKRKFNGKKIFCIL